MRSYQSWKDVFLARHAANPSSTRSAYRSDLDEFERFCGARMIDPLTLSEGDVSNYSDWLRFGGRSEETIKRRMSTLGRLFDLLVERGVRDYSPVRLPKVPTNAERLAEAL